MKTDSSCVTCPRRELREHIKTARRDLFGLRFQHATGELDNTAGARAREEGDRPGADGRPRARN